ISIGLTLGRGEILLTSLLLGLGQDYTGKVMILIANNDLVGFLIYVTTGIQIEILSTRVLSEIQNHFLVQLINRHRSRIVTCHVSLGIDDDSQPRRGVTERVLFGKALAKGDLYAVTWIID